jgi:hypothetical protein
MGDIKHLSSGKSKHWLLKQNFLIGVQIKEFSYFHTPFFNLKMCLKGFFEENLSWDFFGENVSGRTFSKKKKPVSSSAD